MRFCALLVAGTITLVTAAPAAAQYTIPWWTIDGGGGTSQSADGVYVLSGTIGQPDASASLMVGGDYSLAGGFWVFSGAIPSGLRGDANRDGSVGVADCFRIADYLFAGGSAPGAVCYADTNTDGRVTPADIFFLLEYLLAGGTAPTPPNC